MSVVNDRSQDSPMPDGKSMPSSSQAASFASPARKPTPPRAKALYADHTKVYPKAVSGRFRQIKWITLVVTLAIYYILPWLRWDRGGHAPDQAVLLDIANRRFYLFFIELWPQQIYFLTGAMIIAALLLFLATALAGRVWCGYACPQTVWTDLYVLIERWIEGDRAERIRLDKSPWTVAKLGRKLAKHAAWLTIAALTGGAWIFYFTDAPTLLGEMLRFEASFTAVGFIGLFAATTYLLAGMAREQVCTYMCPWPRFQSAMLDEDSLIVTYHDWRGEGRAPLRKSQSWEERRQAGRGDCIDCLACVQVCPVGIDIRDGLQMQCIGCGLCADACDDMMRRVGQPTGLVAFDTQTNAVALAEGRPATAIRLIRPRTIIYSLMVIVLSGAIIAGLVLKPGLDVSVLRDRAPLYVTLSDGSLRNAYTFKVSNMTREARHFTVTTEGLPGALLTLPGENGGSADKAVVLDASPDAVATYRILVTIPAGGLKLSSVPLTFRAVSADGEGVTYDSVFMGPDH